MEIIIKRFEELTTKELYEIIKLRIDIFVYEQVCPYKELDDKDYDAVHIYLLDNNEMVGYLRILNKGVSYPEVTIGRVVTKYRLKGYGRAIMNAGIRYIKNNNLDTRIHIMAQCQAIPFYEKMGFRVCSLEFMEDDIPHKEMILEL